MRYTYLACEWIVQRPKIDFLIFRLASMAKAHGCDFLVKFPFLWDRGGHGYYLGQCIWRGRTRDAIELCLERSAMRFVSCREIEARDFLNMEGDYTDTTIDYGVTGVLQFDRYLEEMGQYNQALLNETPMWATCHWIMRRLSPASVDKILDIADQHSCLLHYLKPEAPSPHTNSGYTLQFMAKVEKVAQMEEFVYQLSPHINFEYWYWLYALSDITPNLNVLREEDLENATPLARGNKAQFLQMVEEYCR